MLCAVRSSMVLRNCFLVKSPSSDQNNWPTRVLGTGWSPPAIRIKRTIIKSSLWLCSESADVSCINCSKSLGRAALITSLWVGYSAHNFSFTSMPGFNLYIRSTRDKIPASHNRLVTRLKYFFDCLRAKHCPNSDEVMLPPWMQTILNKAQSSFAFVCCTFVSI